MEQFSKSERKDLRALAGIAYERELARALTQLEADFASWHAGERSPFDVSDAIHEFHNGIARELYVFYGGNPSTCVAHALATGVLRSDEVASQLAAKLSALVEVYRAEPSRAEFNDPAV